jgi:hypothetical protein
MIDLDAWYMESIRAIILQLHPQAYRQQTFMFEVNAQLGNDSAKMRIV